MSSDRKLEQRMTAQEYVHWERTQTQRHEFYNGEVFSQAGGTRRHSLIGANVLGEVRTFLKGKKCQAHGSDMRVHIEATGYQAYPDVSVACPPFGSGLEESVTNPILVIEVLSPSTADFDRGTKFEHYRQIPTLIEYILVWQDRPRVEQHTRTIEGNWLLRELKGIDMTLQLVSIGHSLALSEIYDKVEFDQD